MSPPQSLWLSPSRWGKAAVTVTQVYLESKGDLGEVAGQRREPAYRQELPSTLGRVVGPQSGLRGLRQL